MKESDVETELSILNTPNTIGIIVIGTNETGITLFHEALKAELNRGIEIVVIDEAKRIPKAFEAEPLIIKSIPRYTDSIIKRNTKPWYDRYQKKRRKY